MPKWLIAVVGTLQAAFIIGGVVMYGQVSGIRADQVTAKEERKEIKKTIETSKTDAKEEHKELKQTHARLWQMLNQKKDK